MRFCGARQALNVVRRVTRFANAASANRRRAHNAKHRQRFVGVFAALALIVCSDGGGGVRRCCGRRVYEGVGAIASTRGDGSSGACRRHDYVLFEWATKRVNNRLARIAEEEAARVAVERHWPSVVVFAKLKRRKYALKIFASRICTLQSDVAAAVDVHGDGSLVSGVGGGGDRVAAAAAFRRSMRRASARFVGARPIASSSA